MPAIRHIPVEELSIDLNNYRTLRQPDEVSAVHAMIDSSPGRFWALMESLLDDGYLPTENIIALKAEVNGTLVVKEGNRRVASMKLILGMFADDEFTIPDNLKDKISTLLPEWVSANRSLPCTIYDTAEAAAVSRVVRLTHGKGEAASRENWSALARARHARDESGSNENALDLLEKYLEAGKNITHTERSAWGSEFPLTILEEAMKKLAPRLGVINAPKLVEAYPKVKYRDQLDEVIKAIGTGQINFEKMRSKSVDFALPFGIPPMPEDSESTTDANRTKSGGGQATGSQSETSKSTSTSTGAGRKPTATSINDTRSVRAALRKFKPAGENREKLVALKDEAIALDISKTPLAFCFVLRSMFELSAKAYCAEHASKGGPVLLKADGGDRKLVEVLKDIHKHLVTLDSGKPDKEKVKLFHAAITELTKQEGLLSVTSMNQLIHNPHFSLTAKDIAITFGNIVRFLEAMN